MAITRRLQRTSKDQYTLTVPKALVEILGLKEQDVIEFSLEKGAIVLKKTAKRGGKK
jgi:bifunctional DNA-binding transcriptional regulator/antitoxin component of YhaV-PrlF toxin-antitoxin module